MDPTTMTKDQANEMLNANAHFANHLYSFIASMSLKCAVQLGIADTIHSHGKPMALSNLADALSIRCSKAKFLAQLMRILVHLGYFSYENIQGTGGDGYALTTASRLLLKDHPCSVKPSLLLVLNPSLLNMWMDLSVWFQNGDPTSFHTSNGMAFWECISYEPELNGLMKNMMASDSKMLANILMSNHHSREIFGGLKSLVDVGGGLGEMAIAIANAYPHIKCIVLDLPHVVEGLEGTNNLSYLAGDMFDAIPPTNAILLKWILHDWSDEYAVKILKQCKKAIISNGFGEGKGKVIIIDIVMDENEEDYKKKETQLFYDMEMMTLLAGKERTKSEWEKLFFDAGFIGGFKMFPLLGFRSVIEVYP